MILIRMDVSVIIPTRNRSAFLALTLRSVLRQRAVDLEVIVIDEASSDDTLSVIASFDDPRIRVIRHETPRGVSTARNHGIAAAATDWIAFLDDDDLWAPDKLALQLQAARGSGASWVYVGHVHIDIRNRVTAGVPPLAPERLIEQLPEFNAVPGGCSGVMVSKRALTVAGGFNTELQPLADWDLWLRLARVGRPEWVPSPLVGYRLHGEQMSLNASRIQREFWMLSSREGGTPNPALLYRYLGWCALRVRNHRVAVRFFVRAWFYRRQGFAYQALASDLSALATDILSHRLRIRLPRRKSSRRVPEEHRKWRSEAQAWVDELVAAANAGHQPRETLGMGVDKV